METICRKCGCRAGFLYLRNGLCKECRLEEEQISRNQNKRQNETEKEKIDSLNRENKPLSQEIKELRATITELRQKGKQAVASRDKYRKRAEIAEREQNEQSQNKDAKFKQVKKMFSKMYHPDSLTGDKFEKLIKQEIFKEFWQVIESIEKNNT